MRISFLNGIVLSLGYIAVLSTLAFPSVGPQDVSQRIEGIGSHDLVGYLESRSPRARGGSRPGRSRPSRPSKKKTPAKKKTSTKKKTATKKKSPARKKTSTRKKTSARKKAPARKKTTTRKKSPVKKRPTKKRPTKKRPTKKRPTKKRPTKKRPTSKKPTPTRPARPTSAKPKSSAIKLLPLSLPPRPTKATNVCLLSGIDCHADSKRSEVNLDVIAQPPQLHSLQKRSRGFTVPLKSGKLELTDKDYYTSGRLEKGDAGARWDEEWVDYVSLGLDNTKVKLYKKRPLNLQQQQGSERDYVTEHILELQSMARFIEALTQTISEGNPSPIPLSVTVDGQWFTDWWNKDIQTEIDSRKPTFKGYQNSAAADHKDKSINDIIFEAFGSKRNVEDFLICEDGINGFKAKLWMDKGVSQDWEKDAPKAAKAFIPPEDYLSVIRTTLAVYHYMELSQVQKKLHSSIENVRTELGNIPHLTNNQLPKTIQGNDVDLAALWIEFMDKQLARFVQKGKDVLNDMITLGLKEFKAELVIMETWLKKMSTSLPDAVKKKHNDAVNKHTLAVQALKGKEKTRDIDLKKYNDELDKIEKKFNNVKADIDKEKKKPGTPYKAAQRQLTNAKAAVTRAEKAVGVARRDALEHDKAGLPKQIRDWKAFIAQLEKYKTESRSIKVLRAQ